MSSTVVAVGDIHHPSQRLKMYNVDVTYLKNNKFLTTIFIDFLLQSCLKDFSVATDLRSKASSIGPTLFASLICKSQVET